MRVRFLQDYRGVLTDEAFYRAGSEIETDAQRGRALIRTGRACAVMEDDMPQHRYPVTCDACGRRVGIAPTAGQTRTCAACDPGAPAAKQVATSPPENKALRPAEDKAYTSADLTQVRGIGPATATKLRAAGVESVADLLGSEAGALATAIDVPGHRVAAWIAAAQELVA